MKPWALLIIAILLETVATSLLNTSDGFKKLAPSAGAVALYFGSFYLLAIALKSLPVGVSYAVWAGVGIVSVTLIGFFVFKEHISPLALAGIALILVGTIVAAIGTQPK